jgi:signal transduction histidine kinase
VQRFRLLLPVLFPSILLLVTWTSVSLTREGSSVAAVWPADAMIMAFLVRWSRTTSERVMVLAMSGGVMIAANLIAGAPLAIGVLLPLANLLGIAVAVRLLGANTSPIESLKAFSAFVLGPVVAAPLVSASAAVVVFAMVAPGADLGATFLRWALADGLGMAIVGSFLLTIGRPFEAPPARRELLMFGAAQLGVLAAASYIFLVADTPPLFLIFPFLVAATMSHRQLGGITAIVTTSVIAVCGTLAGQGPAAVAHLTGFGPIQVMQACLAAMVFTILPISALLQRLELNAAALDEARQRAEELSAIKTRLLAHVSHEIRSPMAGVTSLAELMRDGALGALTDAQKESLSQIASSGATIAALANDLTDAAALQTGKATVHLVQVSVAEAVRSAVAMARHRTSPYDATITVLGDPGPDLAVAADPLRLRQILVNLLVNGAKYGGRPAKVRIGVTLTARGTVRFEVADNGKGIPPADRARLFQDFERLGAERSDLDGAGLGLALSQEIARLQNGALGVEDADEGGARFWLEIPAWSQRAAA